MDFEIYRQNMRITVNYFKQHTVIVVIDLCNFNILKH